MMPSAPPGSLSPERRVALFYLTLYMSGGVATTYAGIWFADHGFSGQQIGILNAAPILVLLGLNLLVGRLADRASDWRQTIIAGAVLAAILPFGLFVTRSFLPLLCVWTLTTISQAAVVPVIDAAALRLSMRRGRDYGALRAWGTVGFMLTIFLTGLLIVRFGGQAFLPLLAGLSVLRGAASLMLPNFRVPAAARVPGPGARRLFEVMRPWFLMPLVGWAMVFATLLVLNAFQGLLWARQGLRPDVIGNLIGLGALSEAAAFFLFRHVPQSVPARTLMLISAIACVLRWLGMAVSPGILLLIPLQLLHGLCFSVGFLGCMRFISNWTSEEIAAETQGFFVMLQQGLSALAILGFGWLTTSWGNSAYAASALLAAAGGALILLSMRLRQPRG